MNDALSVKEGMKKAQGKNSYRKGKTVFIHRAHYNLPSTIKK